MRSIHPRPVQNPRLPVRLLHARPVPPAGILGVTAARRQRTLVTHRDRRHETHVTQTPAAHQARRAVHLIAAQQRHKPTTSKTRSQIGGGLPGALALPIRNPPSPAGSANLIKQQRSSPEIRSRASKKLPMTLEPVRHRPRRIDHRITGGKHSIPNLRRGRHPQRHDAQALSHTASVGPKPDTTTGPASDNSATSGPTAR